jgi:hypothetical protein
MGITDLDLEQALQRQEARWQSRLDFICREISQQVNEGFALICKQINDQINAQVNEGFALHREAIHHLLTRAARDAPTGPLAELQREIAALKANPLAAPSISVTVQHPKRAVQTVERDPMTQEITRTETAFED